MQKTAYKDTDLYGISNDINKTLNASHCSFPFHPVHFMETAQLVVAILVKCSNGFASVTSPKQLNL